MIWASATKSLPVVRIQKMPNPCRQWIGEQVGELWTRFAEEHENNSIPEKARSSPLMIDLQAADIMSVYAPSKDRP